MTLLVNKSTLEIVTNNLCTMKCLTCGEPLKNSDYYCSFGCGQKDLGESIREFMDDYPYAAVAAENCEPLLNNHRHV